MDQVELLTVEDHFQLESVGLVVTPDFPMPDGWQACSEIVAILSPDGQNIAAMANLTAAHFNIPNPNVTSDKRWRVVVAFPSMTKDQVPIGSRILVPAHSKAAVLCRQ